MQSQVTSLTADKDRLQTAESDLLKERDILKKQLQAKQDELSKLKVLISGDIHHIVMLMNTTVTGITTQFYSTVL